MKDEVPIIVDSSVIAKWLCQEGEIHIEMANALLDDLQEQRRDGYAPALSYYEIGNMLLCGKRLTPQKVRDALELLYLLPLTFVHETFNVAMLTYKIAYDNAITYYDATFLALAKTMGGTLVTDDIKHQTGISGIDVIPLAAYPVAER